MKRPAPPPDEHEVQATGVTTTTAKTMNCQTEDPFPWQSPWRDPIAAICDPRRLPPGSLHHGGSHVVPGGYTCLLCCFGLRQRIAGQRSAGNADQEDGALLSLPEQACENLLRSIHGSLLWLFPLGLNCYKINSTTYYKCLTNTCCRQLSAITCAWYRRYLIQKDTSRHPGCYHRESVEERQNGTRNLRV